MGRASRRLLLDSNVWRYIVDAGSLPAVQHAARRSRHTIVVAPAVLYEAAHTPDKDKVVRDKLLTAMTFPAWKRLMPEAYSEAEELKAEVRRLRPEWLRPHPDLTLFNRVRHDWVRARGGLWDRIKDDAALLQRSDASMKKRARDQSNELREDALPWPAQWRETLLTKVLVTPQFSVAGWNGQPLEPWRFDGRNVFITSMATPGHPAIDWLKGEVDLELMLFQSSSLTKFWLHDVELAHMPRHWLRWAFEFNQRQHTVSPGTPVDAQIGTYLSDVDLMLSADKMFVRIAERVRADAPFQIAESRVLQGGERAVESVLEALASA